MNQARVIFKNSAVLAIARLIDRASNVFLTFLVARVFQASGLGIFSAALVMYELISVATEMGATNLIVREIGRDRSNTNRYLVHLSMLSLAVSAILMGLFSLLLPHLGYSRQLLSAMYLIVLAVPAGGLNSILEGVFVAHQRVEFVTIATSVSSLVHIGLTLYLLAQGFGIISLVIAFVVIQYLITLVYIFCLHRFVSVIQLKIEFSFLRSLVNEIKTFAALAILAALFSRPEVLLLSLVSTETQIGYYSAALKVITLWQFIPQIYMTNVFPVLSRSFHLADQQAQTIQDKSVRYLLAVSLPLMVGTAIAAEPILRLLYGDGFESSIINLQLLALNIPFAALFAVLWRVLVARGQQHLVLRAMTFVTTAELIVGYVLISNWASLGASIITPTISLLYVLLLMLYVRQDGTQVDFWRLSWRFVTAAFGMGVLVWSFARQVQLWLLVPISGLVYLALVFLFRAFSSDDIVLFRSIWRSSKFERS